VRYNQAYQGGFMYCDNALSLNITDSDLKNNQASSSGAVLIGMNIRIIGI